MRELKFRAWTQTGRMMQWDELQELRIHTLFKMCQPEIKLMQFTGLQDKNGKEIYEGDIVSCVQSLQVGVRSAGRGRNSYTYSIDEDKTILGRIVFMDGSFHFMSDDVIEYQSSFMRGCGNTKSQVQANYLRTFKHDLNRLLSKIKSSVVVVGNIYENPELLEQSS